MKKPRLMVIGLDSVSLTLLDELKACCPTIRRLMRKGLTGRAMPCFPVYTPTNWAALSTGAGPAATGAAAWHNDLAGTRLSTFDRRAIACDTVFDSAARAGLKTLAISYPTAHPTGSARNRVLVPLDRGLVSNCLVPGKILDVDLPGDGAWPFVLLEPPEAASGAAVAKKVGATEDGASLAGADHRAAARTVRAALVRKGTSWRLRVDEGGKARQLPLRPERWSEPIPVRVRAPGRPGRCVVRVMLFDRGRRLAVSEAYDVGALGKPEALARRVFRRLGPPIEHGVFSAQAAKLFHAGRRDPLIDRLCEAELRQQARWIVDAARLVQQQAPYDVFYLHYHYPDNAQHQYLPAFSGSKAYTPAQQAAAREVMRTCLRVADELVAGLARLAGPKTTILLVSDHGHVPNRYSCNLALRLAEAGLLVRSNGGVDRARSLAWPGGVNTWIEVRAREGTADYERLQEKVLDALLDWKTPEGRRVVAVALKKKDAHLLGYEGRFCPDVAFHYNSGFSWAGGPVSVRPVQTGANHGPQMPVTFAERSDNLAFFALAGPAVRAGVRWDERRDGYVRLVDLVPTACAASGVPAPRHATGAVRRDLFR